MGEKDSRKVRIHFELKRSYLIVGIVFIVFSVMTIALYSESLTLTTSYPSPAGIYQTLVVTAQAILARDAASNGGRVGIGTSTPGSLLDVNGAAHLRGAPGGGGGLYVNGGGSVGIGTLAPAQALDINGSVRTAGFIMPTGAANNYVLTSNGGGVANWKPTQAPSSCYIYSQSFTLTGVVACPSGHMVSGGCNWTAGAALLGSAPWTTNSWYCYVYGGSCAGSCPVTTYVLCCT